MRGHEHVEGFKYLLVIFTCTNITVCEKSHLLKNFFSLNFYNNNYKNYFDEQLNIKCMTNYMEELFSNFQINKSCDIEFIISKYITKEIIENPKFTIFAKGNVFLFLSKIIRLYFYFLILIVIQRPLQANFKDYLLTISNLLFVGELDEPFVEIIKNLMF